MNNLLKIKKWSQTPKIKNCDPDSDYETIEVSNNVTNGDFYNQPKPINDLNRKCIACGNGVPATIICIECEDKSYCDKCDRIFHKHPKRVHHTQKIKLNEIKPPLPPKQIQQIKAPIPPPRRNKQQINTAKVNTIKNQLVSCNGKLIPTSSFSLTKKLSAFLPNNKSSTLNNRTLSTNNLNNNNSNNYLAYRQNNNKYNSQMFLNENSHNFENNKFAAFMLKNIQKPIPNSCSVMDLTQNVPYPTPNFMNGFGPNFWMMNNQFQYPGMHWPQPLMNNCYMNSCYGSMASMLNECGTQPYHNANWSMNNDQQVTSSKNTRKPSRRSSSSSSPSSSPAETSASSLSSNLEFDFNQVAKSQKKSSGSSFSSFKPKIFENSSSSYDEHFNARDKWQCKFCTYINKKSAKICQICSKTNIIENQKLNMPPVSKNNSFSSKEKFSSRSSLSSNYSTKSNTKNFGTIKRKNNSENNTQQQEQISKMVNNLKLSKNTETKKSTDNMFTKEEYEIAEQLKDPNSNKTLDEWLFTDWIKIIDNLRNLLQSHIQQKIVTISEARDILIQNNGNIWLAFDEYLKQDTNKVQQDQDNLFDNLAESFHYLFFEDCDNNSQVEVHIPNTVSKSAKQRRNRNRKRNNKNNDHFNNNNQASHTKNKRNNVNFTHQSTNTIPNNYYCQHNNNNNHGYKYQRTYFSNNVNNGINNYNYRTNIHFQRLDQLFISNQNTNHWKPTNKPIMVTSQEKFNVVHSLKNQEKYPKKSRKLIIQKPDGKSEDESRNNSVEEDLDIINQLTQLQAFETVINSHIPTKECQICSERYPINEMESMIFCVHMCCINCAKQYFTLQIKEKALNYCVCPICQDPKWLSEGSVTNSDNVTDYFSLMDIFLRRILDEPIHDLFQIKVRDFSLNKEENFKWCPKCSSGYFIDNVSLKKYGICENCGYISCLSCNLPWKSQHERISCEMFQKWLKENDYSTQKHGIEEYLKKNGITCPKCKFQFSLSRGGCMHFKCTQCKYEFCSGCNEPFFMSSVCGKSNYCYKLGLHAHHPRNCLFYLRDKEPDELQRLLIDNNIDFSSYIENNSAYCPLPLQKEDSIGKLYDEKCNKIIESSKHGGLCKSHYIEYLVGLINEFKIECVSIMTKVELENELKRNNLNLPLFTNKYIEDCKQIIKSKIPLI